MKKSHLLCLRLIFLLDVLFLPLPAMMQGKEELMLDSARYAIKPLPFNSGFREFSASRFMGGFIFTSDKPRGFIARIWTEKEERLLDLWLATPVSGKKTPFELKIMKGANGPLQDGVALYSEAAEKLYFSRSSRIRGTKGPEKIRSNLNIYSAVRSGKRWKEVRAESLNATGFSTAHPAPDEEGTLMVFSSDRKGGFGGSDLWLAKKDSLGWREAVNLGPAINTTGDELFPFIHSGGTLFYASDGHKGMGGLDVFSAGKIETGWSEPKNCGYPLNTTSDDFGIFWDQGKAKGLVSSDRPGGSGNDDLYSFERKTRIDGLILDSRTQKPVSKVKVAMLDGDNKRQDLVSSDSGTFQCFVEYGKEYMVTFSKEKYLTQKDRIRTSNVGPVDDIILEYQFERELYFLVEGKVVDAVTGMGIADAELTLESESGQKKIRSAADGTYSSQLEIGSDYHIIAMKEGFAPRIIALSTRNSDEPTEFKQDFSLKKEPWMLVQGQAVVKDSLSPIEGAAVRIIAAKKRKEIASYRTRHDGKFFLVINPETEQYLLVGSGKNYFASRVELPVPEGDSVRQLITQQIEMVPYRVGELARTIYYGYKESDITLDASKELYAIIYFLQDNPDASVELGAHTDSRGSSKFNLQLSQERAEAAVRFIAKRGIPSRRISAEGYGETQLLNGCKDGTKCTEEQHALNRRSEIRITGIGK